MATEKLSVILELLAGQFKKEAKEAAGATDRLADRLDKAGRMATNVGAKLTTGLTLPLAGLAVGAVKAASNLSESMNAINVVFGEATSTVEKFGETAAESAGLSQRAFNEAVVPIGQLLNNFGLEAHQSADAVLMLTQRAADLGSTLNIDTAVALEKFQAGLAGEAEPLKAFGVDVSVAAIQAEAMALGLLKSGEQMSKNVRAQAALSIIMRETAFAAGDFGRTLEDSLPNQLKQLKANAEDAAAALGTALLPTVLDMVKGIQGLTERFTELSESQQEFVVKTGLTVAALGPALFAMGKLVQLIKALRTGLIGLGGWAGLIALLKWTPSGTPGIAKVGAAAALAAANYEVLNLALRDNIAKTDEETRAIDAMYAARLKQIGLKDPSLTPPPAEVHDSWNKFGEDIVEIHDSWNRGLAGTQTGLGEVAAESSEAYLAALELADANRTAAKTFRDDLTDAIGGFVTFFDKAVDEIDLSLKQLEKQFDERNTQNERFWNGLAVLARAGLDDLVEELRAQGPEAAGVVEDLVADMDRAFAWERRIEESRRQAASMANALANGLAGVKDTVGAAFNAFGISLADQLEAGFSTADLGNTIRELMDIANPSGVTTPGRPTRQQFHSGGVVGGRWGSDQLILAQGGEGIIPLSQMRGSTTTNSRANNFYFGARGPDRPVDLQYLSLLSNHQTFGKFS